MTSLFNYDWIYDLEIPLSDEQLEGLEEYAAELLTWIRKHQIGPQLLDQEKAREISQIQPRNVFSIESDWATPSGSIVVRVGFGLRDGFYDDCDDYYLGQVAAEGNPGAYPYTEIHLRCTVCELTGLSSDGTKCDFCNGAGERLFDLNWDEDFKVYAKEQRLSEDVSSQISTENDQYLQKRAEWKKEATDYFAERFDLERLDGAQFLVARLRNLESKTDKQEFFYLMIGNTFVYIDVPFAKYADISSISDEFCQWGLGKIYSAITYHTTLPTSAFSGNLLLIDVLLNQMLEDAKKSESRIYG